MNAIANFCPENVWTQGSVIANIEIGGEGGAQGSALGLTRKLVNLVANFWPSPVAADNERCPLVRINDGLLVLIQHRATGLCG